MKIELLLNNTNLTPEQQEFLNLHNQAVQAGNFSSMYAYEFYKILKVIHTNKLYLTCGYDKFEEYTEECFGMKKSQVYKYLRVGDNFSEDFFHSNGKLGVSKINLLLSLGSEEDANEFVSNNDTEAMTVKELESEIKKLKSNITEKDNLINSLESNIDELKNQPVEVKEVIKEVEISNTEELAKLRMNITNLELEKSDLISKIEETSKNSSNDEDQLKKLKKELKAVINEKDKISLILKDTQKKLSLVDNQDFNRFKVQFNFVSQAINDIFKLVLTFNDDEFKNKCYSALNALFEGALKNDKE